MRIAELSFDRHRTRAEAYIPEAAATLELEQAKAHQTHWHLRDHIHTTIEGEEVQLLQANRSIVCRGLRVFNDQAVGMTELSSDDFMQREAIDFLTASSESHTDMHLIARIAIVDHPLSDERWGILLIRQDSHLRCTLDESTIQLQPRTSRQ